VAACQGGRLVVHFTNRKNAPFFFFHMNGDATTPTIGRVLAVSCPEVMEDSFRFMYAVVIIKPT